MKLKNKTLTQIVKEQCWTSRSCEGQSHNVTCWWWHFELCNSVCEYEVNTLTNDNVITEIQNFNTKW